MSFAFRRRGPVTSKTVMSARCWAVMAVASHRRSAACVAPALVMCPISSVATAPC